MTNSYLLTLAWGWGFCFVSRSS